MEESKDGVKEGRRGGVVPPILNVKEEVGEEVVEEEEDEEEEEEATSEGVKEKSGTMVAKQEIALDEAGVKEAEDPAKKEETTLLALLNVLLNEPLNVLLNVPPFDGKNLDLGPVGLMAPKLANTSRRPIGEDRRTEGLAYIRASAAAKASAAEEIRGRLERAVLDQPAPLAP